MITRKGVFSIVCVSEERVRSFTSICKGVVFVPSWRLKKVYTGSVCLPCGKTKHVAGCCFQNDPCEAQAVLHIGRHEPKSVTLGYSFRIGLFSFLNQ